MKALLTGALVCALPWVAIAQIAVLQIKVVEGEAAVHAPGVRLSRPLTVAVTDEAGQPVAGATVSFQLPAEGPGGLFSNGLRTDLTITDTSGRATLHALQLNRTVGQFHIRITAVKEQARAGAISVQYISDNGAAETAVERAPSATPKPAAPQHSPGITPTATVTAQRSPGITPTDPGMRPHSKKKWLVLAILAGAGGAAFLGISHASTHPAAVVSSSVVSIGTPNISVGNPNQ